MTLLWGVNRLCLIGLKVPPLTGAKLSTRLHAETLSALKMPPWLPLVEIALEILAQDGNSTALLSSRDAYCAVQDHDSKR